MWDNGFISCNFIHGKQVTVLYLSLIAFFYQELWDIPNYLDMYMLNVDVHTTVDEKNTQRCINTDNHFNYMISTAWLHILTTTTALGNKVYLSFF